MITRNKSRTNILKKDNPFVRIERDDHVEKFKSRTGILKTKPNPFVRIERDDDVEKAVTLLLSSKYESARITKSNDILTPSSTGFPDTICRNLNQEAGVTKVDTCDEPEEIIVKVEEYECSDYEDEAEHNLILFSRDIFDSESEITSSGSGKTGEIINHQQCHICDNCGKVLTTKNNLSIHELFSCKPSWELSDEYVKFGVKILQCCFPLCGKLFHSKNEMKRHIKNHVRTAAPSSSATKFACPNCGEQFTTCSQRDHHEQSTRCQMLKDEIPRKKPKFSCSVCRREFWSQKSCTAHEILQCQVQVEKNELEKLGVEIRSCSVTGCLKKFGDISTWKKHIKDCKGPKKVQNGGTKSSSSSDRQTCAKCGKMWANKWISIHEGKCLGPVAVVEELDIHSGFGQEPELINQNYMETSHLTLTFMIPRLHEHYQSTSGTLTMHAGDAGMENHQEVFKETDPNLRSTSSETVLRE